eukprot:PhM_4_TR8398/c1_g2_i1/m.62656
MQSLAQMDSALRTNIVAQCFANFERNVATEALKCFTQHLTSRPRDAWSFVRRILPASPASALPADSAEHRMTRFHDHFSALFRNDSPAPTDLTSTNNPPPGIHWKHGPFTMLELDRAARTMANNKSTGIDNIPNELLTLPALRDLVLKALNDMLEHGISADL